MKKPFKLTLILLSLAVAAVCVLPVMSVYISEGESALIQVRGYNLAEFSAWGVVPMIAPPMVAVILLGKGGEFAKMLAAAVLFLGSCVCHVHAFNAAREWIFTLGGSPVTYYPGAFIIPLAFVALLALAAAFEVLSTKEFKLIEENDDV